MSPETAPHRAALRLAVAATLALVWGAMAGEPLPGLTAVLAAQILVVMPRPPQLRQAVTLVSIIAVTGLAAFAVAVGGEVAVVGAGEGAGDGQSDAAASGGSAASRVGAVEAVEDLRQVLGGDAVAGVADGDL